MIGKHNVYHDTYLISDCGPPENISDGAVHTPEGRTYNMVAVYSCLTGYNLTENITRQCTDTGLWSGDIPSCVIIGMIEVHTAKVHMRRTGFR